MTMSEGIGRIRKYGPALAHLTVLSIVTYTVFLFVSTWVNVHG